MSGFFHAGMRNIWRTRGRRLLVATRAAGRLAPSLTECNCSTSRGVSVSKLCQKFTSLLWCYMVHSIPFWHVWFFCDGKLCRTCSTANE